jgi:AcrR family transcriptional regulator
VGVMERREREREEVRRKILDAARDLFMTEGYEKVTMRRIAEAIEYSPTTIYNHFEDKDDLVQALCHEDFSRLFEHLQARPAPADPLEAIRQLGLAYARFGLTHPNQYRFMFMTADKFAHPEDQDASPGEQAFGLLRSAVEWALETGHFPHGDADTIAQALWASIHGTVALLITLPPNFWPHGPARPDLVEQVIEAGIRGFAVFPALPAAH